MEIVHADALKYMASFRDNTMDFIVLDPDYQDWGKLLLNGVVQEAMRVLKPTGNLICFTKQPFDFKLRNAVEPHFRREFVWTFENGGAWCSKKMPLMSTQKIYWCVKSKDFFFNPRTGVAYNSKTKDFKRNSKVFGGYIAEGREFKRSEEGVWLRDHLHYNKPMSGKLPQKPKELVRILLKCFCPEGGNVLDPFAGSGIFSQTAEEMGMNSFASEIDEERCMAILDKSFGTTEQGEE